MRSKEPKAAAPAAPLERKLPEGFKLPVPKLLTPEHIIHYMYLPDVMRRTHPNYVCDTCEELSDLISQDFYESMLVINAEPCEVNVSNGTYKLLTNGELYDHDSNMDRWDNESICTISGEFTYRLNKSISDTYEPIAHDHRLLVKTYENNGGGTYFIDVPTNHNDIQYYWVIVDEGKLYVTNFKVH